MTTHLLVQIIASFIIGGVFVTALSLLAEKSGPKLSGLIISFPSTIILGFIFMGVSLPLKSVISVIPSAIIPLGISVLFAAYYPLVGRLVSLIVHNKNLEIILTLFISIGIWLGLSVLARTVSVSDIYIHVIMFFMLILISHLLLNSTKGEEPVKVKYSTAQKIYRGIFIGSILALVVLLSNVLHPYWGAIFSVFPAAFASMIIILHKQYGISALYPAMRNVALGSVSILAYLISSIYSFQYFGLYFGSVVSLLVSMITSFLIKYIIETKTRMKSPKN